MNYSYIIQPNYCERTLRNLDPIKNYFLFSLLYAQTNRPILVPLEYLQFVDGGARNLQPPLQGLDDEQVGRSRAITRGNTDPQPSSRVATTLQRRPFPRALAAWGSRPLRIFQGSRQSGLTFNSNMESRPQPYNLGLTFPYNLKTHCYENSRNLFFFRILSISLFVFPLSMLYFHPFFFATIED